MPVVALRPQQHSTGLATSCCDMLRPFHSLSSSQLCPEPRFLLTKQGSRKGLVPAQLDRIVDTFIEESEPVLQPAGKSWLKYVALELHDAEGHGRSCSFKSSCFFFRVLEVDICLRVLSS